jgi:hypothetical protein
MTTVLRAVCHHRSDRRLVLGAQNAHRYRLVAQHLS